MGTKSTRDRAPARRWVTALAAAGVLAGGVAAGVIGVTAATAAPVLTAASTSPGAATGTSTDAETKDDGGRAGETVVTGTKADTLRAAALAAVPGATVVRIETDADGAAYEVHLTKADGSRATVTFDASLAKIGVESGMGSGGHGDRDGDGDGDGESATS